MTGHLREKGRRGRLAHAALARLNLLGAGATVEAAWTPDGYRAAQDGCDPARPWGVRTPRLNHPKIIAACRGGRGSDERS